jgi:hypothetical protein
LNAEESHGITVLFGVDERRNWQAIWPRHWSAFHLPNRLCRRGHFAESICALAPVYLSLLSMAEQNKGGEGGESIPRVLCAPRYAVEAQRRGFTRLPRPVPSQAEQRVEDVAREKKETAAEDQRTKRATKIVVSIILTENKQPDLLKR